VRHWTTTLILTALAAGCQGGASDRDAGASDASPTMQRVISLHPYFRDLRSVRAVRGSDTLTFLLDTGGGATVISPALAASIGCRPYGRQVGHRMSGEPVAFQACDSISFVLDGWSVRHAPVAVFDVNGLLPPSLPKLDGILSLETFRDQVITIDWPRSRIVVHSTDERGPALARQGLPARFATGDNGGTISALVPVEGRRGPLWFLLDSGDILGTLVDSHVVQESLLTLRADSTADLAVGDRAAERIRVTVVSINLDGVLGTAYLLKGPVSLDLRSVP
jgi:hypothetical protein